MAQGACSGGIPGAPIRRSTSARAKSAQLGGADANEQLDLGVLEARGAQDVLGIGGRVVAARGAHRNEGVWPASSGRRQVLTCSWIEPHGSSWPGVGNLARAWTEPSGWLETFLSRKRTTGAM